MALIVEDAQFVREVHELAALVAGREPAATVARLRALEQRLRTGTLPDHSDLAFFERMRARYGRELADRELPEPW